MNLITSVDKTTKKATRVTEELVFQYIAVLQQKTCCY